MTSSSKAGILKEDQNVTEYFTALYVYFTCIYVIVCPPEARQPHF